MVHVTGWTRHIVFAQNNAARHVTWHALLESQVPGILHTAQLLVCMHTGGRGHDEPGWQQCNLLALPPC